MGSSFYIIKNCFFQLTSANRPSGILNKLYGECIPKKKLVPKFFSFDEFCHFGQTIHDSKYNNKGMLMKRLNEMNSVIF